MSHPFDLRKFLVENKLTKASRTVSEAIDASRLELDERAVKNLYTQASPEHKSLFNRAIQSLELGTLELDDEIYIADSDLVEQVSMALEQYTYELFPSAPDDEVFIDHDAVIEIVNVMASVA